ncbi:PIN domain-containing protein [Rothia sp. 11273D007AR]
MSSDIYRIVLDTNVLMSKTLRDWIFLTCLETNNLFYQVYLSQGILDEFGYHWRKQHPHHDDAVRQRYMKQIMDSATGIVEGFKVETPAGYPDEHDAHVHSAVLASTADALITDDSKLIAFGQSCQGEEALPYDTMSADDFLMQMAHFIPPEILDSVYLKQETYLEYRNPDATVPSLLRQAGALNFARHLQTVVIPRL